MYSLIIDPVNNLIYIELPRHLTKEQILNHIDELNSLCNKFKAKTYSLLIVSTRLAPLSQENLPCFQKAIEIVLPWAKRIGVINGNRILTLIQMKRLEEEARRVTNSETKIMRFRTKQEALHYLSGTED